MAGTNTDDKVIVEDGAPREQDKFLPIANISRIMKEGLPQNAKISKDAKELVQQCVSDFIIFITSECDF
jgi:nuclear transcription Y subunit beta